MLTLLVTLSLSSYSQTDTLNKQDTTKVVLSTRVARLVYQDLLRYDGAKLEIVELKNQIQGQQGQGQNSTNSKE